MSARDPTPAGQERPNLGAPDIADIARDRKSQSLLKRTPSWDSPGMTAAKTFGILVEGWGEGVGELPKSPKLPKSDN